MHRTKVKVAETGENQFLSHRF